MSTELKEVNETASTKSLSVTRFFNKVPKLQLTQSSEQGFTSPVAQFVHLDREQAAELMVTLAEFLVEGNQR
ncbi:MAG: hypothetical protein DRQ58_10890 [Gammaproteobacteria bacterium]|nr:MAG: hypothetical protein DRQ58_10890 [Gammaproteobacteria bacterium]